MIAIPRQSPAQKAAGDGGASGLGDEDEQRGSQKQAVDDEDRHAGSCDELHEEVDDRKRCGKGDRSAQEHVAPRRPGEFWVGKELVAFEHARGQDHRHGEQEGEARCRLRPHPEEETCGERDARARGAGHQGERLGKADDDGARPGEGLERVGAAACIPGIGSEHAAV